MQNKPQIRRATRQDVPALRALLSEQAAHHAETLHASAQALERYGFSGLQLFRCLLAQSDAGILGFALYYPDFSTLRGQPGVMVQDLFLLPEARGLGLGRALLAHIAVDGRDWDAAFLTLMLDRQNHAARAFYQRQGFVPRGDYDVMILEGEGLGGLTQT